MSSASKTATTFWRVAGLSYLQVRSFSVSYSDSILCAQKKPASHVLITFHTQFLNRSATAVRSVLKEPAKRQAMAQETFSYKSSAWKEGVQGPKTPMGTPP